MSSEQAQTLHGTDTSDLCNQPNVRKYAIQKRSENLFNPNVQETHGALSGG